MIDAELVHRVREELLEETVTALKADVPEASGVSEVDYDSVLPYFHRWAAELPADLDPMIPMASAFEIGVAAERRRLFLEHGMAVSDG